MQAYENKTQHMLNKIIGYEPLCVCVLRTLITKDKILPFSNYNVRTYNFYKHSRHTCNLVVAHWCAPAHRLRTTDQEDQHLPP
jgi:hypothetical protein